MSEIINIKNIQLNQKVNDWEEAIRITSKPLLENNSIEPIYVENMVNSVKELGPYIVIMPQFALAHAAPGVGVKVSDMSIATFPDGVNFNCENDPVKVVLCLACIDKISHLDKLQKVATTLMDDSIIEKMCACKSEQELYEILNTGEV
ncbi:PTS sugar transporter subunit IIA [Breznakia pachnodae]|uniref:Ascorbate-specific PTS system EIIA component n=1 Tax=Breznakia pachnodae TaxID=265178 RepID=A0ABU0E0M2_9FIRM|nr:PTS sugar transporter subunit IIA [Breznakia pachnodae]MDQ0360360.1 PTS system ascorbate-specific IIA component [Breznakia pachnodae]